MNTSEWELYTLRQTIMVLLQSKNVKVGLFIAAEYQNPDGTFNIRYKHLLPPQVKTPGTITFVHTII